MTKSAATFFGHQADLVSTPDPDNMMTSKQVRAKFGNISEMSLWRWTRERGFPPPDLIVARRKFWRRATVQTWIDAQITEAADGGRGR